MSGPDERSLALEFFDGRLTIRRRPNAAYTDPREGLPSLDIKFSSEEEAVRREAIRSQLLSGAPSRELLERLAAVFAPDGPNANPRRADLVYRRKGRPEDEVENIQLILDVELELRDGSTRENAISAVAQKHGLEEGKVRSVIDRHPDLRRQISEAVRPQK